MGMEPFTSLMEIDTQENGKTIRKMAKERYTYKTERSMKAIGGKIRKMENVRCYFYCIVLAVYPNGDKYEGQWDTGVMNGKGKFVYADGKVYEGELKDGKKSGKGNLLRVRIGVFDYANGDKYDGDWLDEERSGNGINNNLTPLGIYYYKCGDRYEGQWKHNTKEGHGKLHNYNRCLLLH